VLTLCTSCAAPKKRYGVASACIGGGQGIAMLIENPSRLTRRGGPLIRTRADGRTDVVALTPGKRVLFLTKDPRRSARSCAASSTSAWRT
jgi:hypothetical protein